MNVFSKFRNAKSSEEFGDLEAKTRERLAEAEAAVVELKARRVSAIEAGDDAAVVRLRQEIRDKEASAEELSEAVEAAARRKAEAREREHAEAVEERMATGSAMRDELIELLRELYKLADQSVAAVLRARELEQGLQQLHVYAVEEGRSDLIVRLPLDEWREKVRLERIAEYRRLGHDKPEKYFGLEPGAAIDLPFPWRPEFCIPGFPLVPHGRERHWMKIVGLDR